MHRWKDWKKEKWKNPLKRRNKRKSIFCIIKYIYHAETLIVISVHEEMSIEFVNSREDYIIENNILLLR